MKKKSVLLWLTIGIAVASIPSIGAEGQSFSASGISSACKSFGVQKIQEKKEAIPFSLNDLKGNQVSLRDFKGKPILLFFWASWCIACKEEIVLLEKFFEGKKGQFEILTIVIDGEREKKVKQVIEKNKITLPVLLDEKEKLARNYGVRMVPTVFFVNREGYMVGMVIGQREWDGPEALFAIRELFCLN